MVTFTIIAESYLIYKCIADIILDEYGNVNIIENIDYDDLQSQLTFSGKKLIIIDWMILEKFKHYFNQSYGNIIVLPVLINDENVSSFKQFNEHIFLKDDRRNIINKINKSLEIINKIYELPENTYELSKREKLILQLVAKGYTTKMIADKLNISSLTVSSHRKNIGSKLGIKTASGLTTYAIINGLVEVVE